MGATVSKQTVGVMGSGTDEHGEHSQAVGVLLAELGVNLLTGGGDGVMRAISRAFTQYPGDRGICFRNGQETEASESRR
jgi:predicted Rossmann-fold nucleotide-binding protein